VPRSQRQAGRFLGRRRGRRSEATFSVAGWLRRRARPALSLRVQRSRSDFAATTDRRSRSSSHHEFPGFHPSTSCGAAGKPTPTSVLERPRRPIARTARRILLGGEPALTEQPPREAVKGGWRLRSGKLGRRITRLLPVKVDRAVVRAGGDHRASGRAPSEVAVGAKLFLSYAHPRTAHDENASRSPVYSTGGPQVARAPGGDRAHYDARVVWAHAGG